MTNRHRPFQTQAWVYIFILSIVLMIPAHALGERLGAAACQQCHSEIYNKWLSGPHARSGASLTGSLRTQASCRSCHSNGTRPSMDVPLTGVDCESCHGGGSLYAVEHIMKDRVLAEGLGLVPQSEAVCLTCHLSNTPNTAPFNYEKALQSIQHW